MKWNQTHHHFSRIHYNMNHQHFSVYRLDSNRFFCVNGGGGSDSGGGSHLYLCVSLGLRWAGNLMLSALDAYNIFRIHFRMPKLVIVCSHHCSWGAVVSSIFLYCLFLSLILPLYLPFLAFFAILLLLALFFFLTLSFSSSSSSHLYLQRCYILLWSSYFPSSTFFFFLLLYFIVVFEQSFHYHVVAELVFSSFLSLCAILLFIWNIVRWFLVIFFLCVYFLYIFFVGVLFHHFPLVWLLLDFSILSE